MSTVATLADATPDARGDAAGFYDARVAGKLADFVRANPRIEAAIETLAEWTPRAPRRVLEIGCGVGATTWRMARAWPAAEVVGADFSAASIEAARACFQRPNLAYRLGRLAECRLDGVFDLIVLMDVYEHIAPSERADLHAELGRLLSAESRLFLSVPTPAHQAYLRAHAPDALQPVDEDIGAADMLRLAEATRTRLVCYREVGIWRYGDYAHAVLARGERLQPVALRQDRGGVARRLKAVARRLAGRPPAAADAMRDQLGRDLQAPGRPDLCRRFKVTSRERRRSLAAKRLVALTTAER